MNKRKEEVEKRISYIEEETKIILFLANEETMINYTRFMTFIQSANTNYSCSITIYKNLR